MSKAEILKKFLLLIDSPNIKKNVGDRWTQFIQEESTTAILASMDEYAKQEAVSFLIDTTGDSFKHNAKQLYEQYLKSKELSND